MKILSILLICTLHLSAAITAGLTVNWDVRTGGSDTNGGAFDSGVGSPGTDESQANAGTSVTVTIGVTTTQGTSVPAFTSTTHGPGNVLNITGGSGCTTGRFEMLSQATGTGTFDRSLGSAASVCTGTLGGSLQTQATAAAAIASGNIVNVQAGTYSITSRITVNTSSIWIGYQTTHQDGGTKPLITTSTNSTNLWNTAVETQFVNMSFSNTAGTPAGAFNVNSGNQLILTNDLFTGFTNAINGGASSLNLTNVEIKNSTSHGIVSGTLSIALNGCWIHDNAGSGVDTSPGNNIWLVVNNTIISANANGITSTGSLSVYVNNSDIANNTTDGINISSSAVTSIGAPTFTNNIFYGNGRYAINYSGGAILGYNMNPGQTNAYGGQGTANFNNTSGSPGDITLTSNPFTSSTNFVLNATAGGGAILKGLGFPGTFPGGATIGVINVGAVQGSGGGGGGGQVAYPR